MSFDARQVYVSIRAGRAADRVVADDMRRDGSGIYTGNDNVLFMFDTFYDRRNGVAFTISALGGRMDGQVAHERDDRP